MRPCQVKPMEKGFVIKLALEKPNLQTMIDSKIREMDCLHDGTYLEPNFGRVPNLFIFEINR